MDHCDGPIREDTGAGICCYFPEDTDFDCADCPLDKVEPPEEPNPNPGSDSAVGQGCLCPTSENNQGQGFSYPGASGPCFVMNRDCPLHGWSQEEADEHGLRTEEWGE